MATVHEQDLEFGLPSHLQLIKDEALSGQTWSMNLEVPDSGSFDTLLKESPTNSSSTPLSSISSHSTVRRPIIRAPPTHRDSIYYVIYFLLWTIMLSLLFFSKTSFRVTIMQILIIVSCVCGTFFASLIFLGLFHGNSRALIVRNVEVISTFLLLSLAIMFLSVSLQEGRLVNWGFLSYLVISSIILLGQIRRTRDRLEFLLVLIDMTLEVLGKYRLIIVIIIGIVVLFSCFIAWWVFVFSAYLRASLLERSIMFTFLTLNLYWTSQIFRLIIVIVTMGIVTHWFANAYPEPEEEEEEVTDLKDTPQQVHSPLLFDGTLLPPYPKTIEKKKHTIEKKLSHIPEAANGGPNKVCLHFLRIALSTSLGSCCKGALACLPVYLADMVILASFSWPRLILCVDNAVRLVRSHHEVLFVHVASYSKSFATAADDIWCLVDDSGLQVVFDDDVCGGVLRALSLAIAALVAATVGLITYDDGEIWGYFVIFAFAVAYMASSLSLQVIDSSVMAIYMAFAEHPQSIQANYPIVHHRFERITEFSSYDN